MFYIIYCAGHCAAAHERKLVGRGCLGLPLKSSFFPLNSKKEFRRQKHLSSFIFNYFINNLNWPDLAQFILPLNLQEKSVKFTEKSFLCKLKKITEVDLIVRLISQQK